jgi:hypothetical protein
MGTGANATAVAYVELRRSDGTTLFGVGIDKNIVTASLKAVVSGVNRMLTRGSRSAESSKRRPTAETQAEPTVARSFIARALKQRHGLDLPPKVEAEMSKLIDGTGPAVSAERVCEVFETEFLAPGHFGLLAHESAKGTASEPTLLSARISAGDEERTIEGAGAGPLGAFIRAMAKESGRDFDLADFREHIIGTGANAGVAAYVELKLTDGSSVQGVGIDNSMAAASLKAVVSAVNRMLRSLRG